MSIRHTRFLGLAAFLTAGSLGIAAAPAQPAELYGLSLIWPHSIKVDCDRGQSLARALLWRGRPGAIIRVRGVCHERITIRTDWITIDGGGTASIDGTGVGPADPEFNPLIDIDGATGVTVKGLTVENSAAEGVFVRNGASATLQNLVVRNNANAGLFADHAKVTLVDTSSNMNLIGMDHINNASTVMQGQIDLSRNGFFGLGAANGSAIELRGAALDVSSNGQLGMIIEGAHLGILNFGVSVPSSIAADENGQCGIVLAGLGRFDLLAPPPLFHTGVHTITASRNVDCGIWMIGGSIESPFGGVTFSLEDNQVGLRAENDSSLAVVGGMGIRSNAGIGLLGDGAGSLSIVSSPGGPPSPNPSEITGNGTDVDLRFGSRASLFGTAIGTVVCDGTALVRGAACP